MAQQTVYLITGANRGMYFHFLDGLAMNSSCLVTQANPPAGRKRGCFKIPLLTLGITRCKHLPSLPSSVRDTTC